VNRDFTIWEISIDWRFEQYLKHSFPKDFNFPKKEIENSEEIPQEHQSGRDMKVIGFLIDWRLEK
jgi:hypothetical protein